MNDSKLIQIGGKSYKECEVVMLPTKEQRWKVGNQHDDRYEFYSFVDKKLYSRQSNAHNWSLSHLYILSSKEIKEGDWYMYCHFGEWIISNSRETLKKGTNTLENLNKDDYFKKIIATTDFELRTPDSGMKAGYYMKDSIPLPRPSDDFIKAFVKAEGKINEVLVEYDYKFSTISEGKPGFPEDDISWWNYKLKVSSDNTVTIRAFEKEKRSINDVHKECLNYLLTQIEKPADPMNNLVSFNAAQMALNLMVSEIKLGRVKI